MSSSVSEEIQTPGNSSKVGSSQKTGISCDTKAGTLLREIRDDPAFTPKKKIKLQENLELFKEEIKPMSRADLNDAFPKLSEKNFSQCRKQNGVVTDWLYRLDESIESKLKLLSEKLLETINAVEKKQDELENIVKALQVQDFNASANHQSQPSSHRERSKNIKKQDVPSVSDPRKAPATACKACRAGFCLEHKPKK